MAPVMATKEANSARSVVHGCWLLKITSRNFQWLEVLRAAIAGSFGVMFGNCLEALTTGNQLLIRCLLLEGHVGTCLHERVQREGSWVCRHSGTAASRPVYHPAAVGLAFVPVHAAMVDNYFHENKMIFMNISWFDDHKDKCILY